MHIHYLLTDLNSGGAAQPIPDLVALMRDQGHTVRVLALLPKDRKGAAQLDRAGIAWELLGNSRRDTLPAARALLRILREDRPDLLWTSLTRATIYGAIAGWLCGIPVLSWQHNSWLKPGDRRLLRLSRRLTALWVADSRTVAEFAAQSLDIARSKIEVWPLFRARTEVPVARPCAPGTPFRIGGLGRLHADKNFCHLIAAAALISERDPALATRLEFVIGGQGGEHARLAAQIAAAGLDNVRLAGYVDDPIAFLSTLHAYVQPSHHEGLCIAAHEAMQAALPVIATRVGELCRSVLPGETGYLAEVGDVPAIAQAIIELARDPARAARLGAAGRERVLSLFGEAEFRRAGIAVLRRAASPEILGR